MRRFIRESVSINFVLTVILVMFFTQSLLWLWSVQKQKRLLENQLEERLNEYALMIQSLAVIKMEKTGFNHLAEDVVNSMLNNKDIYSVEIFDNKGKRVLSKSKPYLGESQKSIDFPIKSDKKTLGKITIRYSDDRIKKAITSQIIDILFLQLGGFIVIIGVILFLFQKKIATPLYKIQNSIEQITVGDLTHTLDVRDSNEFGVLSKTINFLSERLRANISRLKSGIKNAVAAISQLTLSCGNLKDTISHQRNLMNNAIEDIKKSSETIRNVSDKTTQLQRLSEENHSAILQLRATNDEITQTTWEFRRQIDQCSFAISELRQDIKELNSKMAEASISFEEASASIDEIRKSITEIDKAAKLSADLSQKATEIISSQGINSVQDILKGMESIVSEVNILSQTIKSLGNRSEDIEKIVTVINDIAEKTRLLSLNAQILAIQSGEQGKSFAVVASQMSELSEKTAASTGEIVTLVSDIKKEIKGMLNEINKVVTSVKQGSKLVHNASGVLQEIYKASKETSDMAVSIKRSTGEQTKGLSMVLNAIENLKSLIESIIRIVHDQDEKIKVFVEGISKIRDSVDFIENSIAQQSENTGYLSENLEKTTESVSQISRLFFEEKHLNHLLTNTINEINRISQDTEREIREILELLKSLQTEVEELHKELEMYTVKK